MTLSRGCFLYPVDGICLKKCYSILCYTLTIAIEKLLNSGRLESPQSENRNWQLSMERRIDFMKIIRKSSKRNVLCMNCSPASAMQY